MTKLQFRQHLENKFEGVVIKDTARWEYIQKQNGEYEEY